MSTLRLRCSISCATISACKVRGSVADSASAALCTVIINGAATRSCITPVSAVKGEITTLEGLAKGRQAAPAAAGLDRRAGSAVRLLPERADHDRQGAAGQESESDRRADPRGNEQDALPLHDVLPRSGRHQARGEGDGGGRGRLRRRRWSHDNLHKGSETRRRSIGKLECDNVPQELAQERRPAGGELRRRGHRPAHTVGESPSPPRRLRVRIPTPTSINSIRGSSSMRTAPRRSMSARRTAARAPGRLSGS